MTDFEKKNYDRSAKLERIIASLKQQRSQNNNYIHNQLNETKSSGNNRSFIDSDKPVAPSNVQKESNLFKYGSLPTKQLNIKEYFDVTKTVSSNKNISALSVLRTLKTNREHNLRTVFGENSSKTNVPKDNNNQNEEAPNTRVDVNSCKKSCFSVVGRESLQEINDKGEEFNMSLNIVRKTQHSQKTYCKRPNNKKLKLSGTAKQSNLMGYFNVEENISQVIDSKTTVLSNVLDNMKDTKTDVWRTGTTHLGNFSRNRDETNSISSFFKNIKTGNDGRNLMHKIRPELNISFSNKENIQSSDVDIKRKTACHTIFKKKKSDHSTKTIEKTSFDDFCKNVIAVIPNGSKTNHSEKLVQNTATNLFSKSYSTGNIVRSQRKIGIDPNSLPITDKEITYRKQKLTQNKITFDDFIKNILEEVKTSANEHDKKDCGDYVDSPFNCEQKIDLSTRSKENAFKESKSCNGKVSPKNFIKKTNRTLTKTDSSLELFSTANYLEKTYMPCFDFNKTENSNTPLKCDVIITQNIQKNVNESSTKNTTKCKQLSAAELSTAESQPLTILDHNIKDSSIVLQESLPLGLYNQIVVKDSAKKPKVLQNEGLINRQECSYKGGDNDECFDRGNMSDVDEIEQFSQQPFNISKENFLKSVVSENMSQHDLLREGNESQSENAKTIKLDEFLKKLLEQSRLGVEKICEYKNKVGPSKKMYIKRYRKGSTKIYRLKKLKKARSKAEVSDGPEETLTFDDLFKKITQDIVTTKNELQRSKSASSISTSSSYITDVTKSEILSTGSNELTSPKQRLRKGFNEISKDKSLLFCEEQWENGTEYNKEEIKMKIQEMILKVLDDFSERGSSSLTYRKQSFSNCIFKDGRLQLKPLAQSSMTVINSKTQRSQAKFTLIIYLLKKIQNLLETNTKLTKRELYYQLKTLIKDQQVTDRAINAVSCLLDVGMWALNIIAQKGLVFGNLKMVLSSGETVNCNVPGTLIPQNIEDIVEIESPAYFILVVEKESIFYKLIEEDLPNRLTRPFIMITGKGFPDLNTQLFLKKLWMIMSIPVFILVDADPHGINIMLNYRFGSVKNAHVSHELAVPNAKWLGVYPSEVINLNITREPLSERELKLVGYLLNTPYMNGNPRIVNELNVLLEKKYKAEIEGLIKSDTYLSEVYLPNKFFAHNFI